MRKNAIATLVFALSMATFSATMFAHHGTAAFETDKRITLKGTVTEWFWSNPHCLLRFDVKGDNGQVAHWIGETQNPVTMTNGGWSKASFKVGDEVSVVIFPVKNGLPLGRIVTVTLPDGKMFDALKGTSGVRDYK
jgi:Family of unknown function (DUF6152)